MVNEILGERYEIQQPLAKKAGRRTLLARDLLSRELVVVKLLTFSDDFEWDDLKLFEREAQTLKALSHPAIPRYLDYLELEAEKSKGFALVQTYVAGKSLEEYLQAGRTFAEADVKEIVMILFDLFGQIRLHIDREQIALSYQLFGLRPHYTLSAPRQQIIKLERNRAIYKTDADGNAVQVKSQINIWAGTQKFEIGVDGLLSEIELDWLAHELSDWLELPISSDE